MRLTRSSFLALLLLPGIAAARHPDCNPEGAQDEMNICAVEELGAADEELNKVYRAILARNAGDPLFIEKFKAAQRLWIQLRDAEVEARLPLAEDESGQFKYGSSFLVEETMALKELTEQRTRYLRAQWLSDQR